MAVREFDGVDDRIICSGGAVGTPGVSACSVLLLIKPSLLSFRYPIVFTNTSDGALQALQLVGTDSYAFQNQFGGANGTLTLQANVWQLLGVCKAAGFTVPRFHRCELGGSWQHANGDGSQSGPSGACDQVIFGSSAGGNYQAMRLAVAAAYDVRLTDADFESVINASSQIEALDPAGQWHFNQTAITDVTDLVGSADQTSVTGTTVVSDDDPAWTYVTAAESGPANKNFGFAGGLDRMVWN